MKHTCQLMILNLQERKRLMDRPICQWQNRTDCHDPHHGSPPLSLYMCVLSFPVCIIHPVSLHRLFCVYACGRGLVLQAAPGESTSVINPPIKPVDSVLLVARSFHQSTWLFASWLLCVFAFVFYLLACVANTSVFLPMCSSHWSRVCYFPPCLSTCLPVACSPVFPLSVSTLKRWTTLRCATVPPLPCGRHQDTLTLPLTVDFTSHVWIPGQRTTPPPCTCLHSEH